MPRHIVVVLIAILLTACASGSATIVGDPRKPIHPSQVKLYSKAPVNCEVIAIVNASSDSGRTEQASLDYAIQELKNQAARLGANGVVIETTGEGISMINVRQNLGYVQGTGFSVPVTARTVSGTAIFVIE